jgi:hypothetical protein
VGPAMTDLAVGTPVCVWDYYRQGWSEGFVVDEALPVGYRVRRLSDGHLIDHVLSGEEIMVDRRRQQLPGFEGTERDRRQPGGQSPTDPGPSG